MKISESTYNQLNELIFKSFDCNAMADNLAYNIDYADYSNIANVYHHSFAHKFSKLADEISGLMLKLDARPIRKALNSYTNEYLNLIEIFEDNKKLADGYRVAIKKTIDIADINDDYEVKIAMENFLLNFLPYVKQSEIWLKKVKQYKESPQQFDIHFKELTTLIPIE